jgi:hypothetical protein
MLTKNKIKDTWKAFGWENEICYHSYLNQNKHIGFKTLDVLNPDKISPRAFWKATDEHFGTDTVCNVSQEKEKRSLVIQQCNTKNHKIPLYMGTLGFMELAIRTVSSIYNGKVSIAEIGCGYGSFYENFVCKRNDITLYRGFDVVKRFDQAYLVKGKDGTFTKKQIEELKCTVNIFYSCNVFQHLTPKKIKKYLKQIHEILPCGGRCVLTYIKKPRCGVTYHYGQAVEIMNLEEFYNSCIDAGFTIESKVEQSFKDNVTFDSVGVLLTKFE